MIPVNNMQVIPVLDLLNGVTVQAVAGRRDEYRPVRSCLTDSVDPSVVLSRLNEVCRSESAYIADLDAILNRSPNRWPLAELSRMDLNLMVDVGIQSCSDVEELLDLAIENVVVGLESLPSARTAQDLIQAFGADTLILSLDLKSGIPLARHEPWTRMSPLAVLKELIEMGFRRWIILDLSVVGTARGVCTGNLCSELRRQRPSDEIITGGGIRCFADLGELETIGIDGVLVASALHQGTVSAEDLSNWHSASAGP
jgi:HisA/HisF family protein